MDEKWFYAHPGGSLLYLPPGVQPPVLRVKHKRHIPKVMFLAALGQPTANFNGSVGIWPVQKLYTPKRASRAHPRENNQLVPYLKECVMDGEVFVRMIKEDYIPKVVELGSVMLQAKPVGAKLTVWSQLDTREVTDSVSPSRRSTDLVPPAILIYVYTFTLNPRIHLT